MKKMMYTHHKAVRDVLTDKQKDKIKELRKGCMEGPGDKGDGPGMRKKIRRHGG